MKETTLAILTLLIGVSVAHAQAGGTATATTCSIANTGANVSKLTINCGIGKEQGATIVKLLNKVLASQDPAKILAALEPKLDEILVAASKPAQACVGSNCSGSGVVSGDNNVVGNVVTGNQNLVGNNNQLNVGLYPARVFPTEHLTEFENYLRALPSKALILYPNGDSEAYGYADNIATMLRAANWTVNGPNGALISSNGGPLYGLAIAYRGPAVAPGQTVPYSPDQPWGRITGVMLNIQNGKDLTLSPGPNATEGLVQITVNANPKSNPRETSPQK